MRQLLRAVEGSAAVEFALVAPVFFAMLFGVLETSRIFWIKQTLDEVAYHTARCMSVSATCDTLAAQKDYAVNRASDYGIGIASSDVQPVSGTTCKGATDSNSVTISKSIDASLGGIIPKMPDSLSAVSCYPMLN